MKKEEGEEGPLTETIEVELNTLSHRCPLFLLKNANLSDYSIFHDNLFSDEDFVLLNFQLGR